MELNANVHEEDGSLWADVDELPGCFASGANLNELADALMEAIMMMVEDRPDRPTHFDLNLHLGRVPVYA